MRQFPALGASATLTTTLAVAVFTCHMVTCIWFLIGDNPHGWVYSKFPPADSPCPEPDSPQAAGMACEPDADILVKCEQDPRTLPRLVSPCLTPPVLLLADLFTFWWSISILLGSELILDIQPRSHGEVVVTIICQIFSAVLFGMIIGEQHRLVHTTISH